MKTCEMLTKLTWYNRTVDFRSYDGLHLRANSLIDGMREGCFKFAVQLATTGFKFGHSMAPAICYSALSNQQR